EEPRIRVFSSPPTQDSKLTCSSDPKALGSEDVRLQECPSEVTQTPGTAPESVWNSPIAIAPPPGNPHRSMAVRLSVDRSSGASICTHPVPSSLYQKIGAEIPDSGK